LGFGILVIAIEGTNGTPYKVGKQDALLIRAVAREALMECEYPLI
jgi:hypothetical protein